MGPVRAKTEELEAEGREVARLNGYLYSEEIQLPDGTLLHVLHDALCRNAGEAVTPPPPASTPPKTSA
jgi:hypothetical protein